MDFRLRQVCAVNREPVEFDVMVLSASFLATESLVAFSMFLYTAIERLLPNPSPTSRQHISWLRRRSHKCFEPLRHVCLIDNKPDGFQALRQAAYQLQSQYSCIDDMRLQNHIPYPIRVYRLSSVAWKACS
jgi:hypothetical protein